MKKSLTKTEILRLKTDIDRVFNAGEKERLFCFKVYAIKNTFSFSRFVVIPVKHYGNSVQRNLIRRQVKEIWRTNKQNVPAGFDFAIIVFPGYEASFEEKENNLLKLLNRVSSKWIFQ